MHRIDGPGATVDHRFTDGDPVAGIQATMVTDDWANDVQEEIISVLVDRGITPVKGTQNQLLLAIKAIFGIASTETVAGSAKIATQALTNAGVDDATIITPKKMRFGFSILLGQNGYIAFPSWMGGLTIQWARATLAVSGGYAWTYPTPFTNAVFNCWASVYAPSAADVVNRTSQPIAPGLTACAFALSANGAAIAASTSISLLAIGY